MGDICGLETYFVGGRNIPKEPMKFQRKVFDIWGVICYDYNVNVVRKSWGDFAFPWFW